ncbi:MAG: flagellar export chaperone FlgN [Lachnospiraceae bacterium]
MYNISDFIKNIKEQIAFFTNAIAVEQTKLDAAEKNRVSFVEDCMKKEQVMILKLRGFDKKRDEIQASLGFKDYTFQQIIDASDEEQAAQLTPLFQELNAQVTMFRNTCDSAKAVLELNLHTVNSVLAQMQQASDNSYSAKGETKKDQKHFTNRTI